jgi:hypothetical protein
MKIAAFVAGGILLVAACGYAGYGWLKSSDFDRMCAMAEKLQSDAEFLKLEPAMRAATLAHRIDDVIYMSPARTILAAVAVASPLRRLEVRGSAWTCPAFDHLYGQQ